MICSHTLEDVRDPIWVCSEIQRVAKAGYIEVPSRLEEQSYGFQGPWVGWGHHHWLIEVHGTGSSSCSSTTCCTAARATTSRRASRSS